jgi:hypothetical protein
MTPDEVRRAIADCPAEPHIGWALAHIAEGSSKPDADTIAIHCAFGPDDPLGFVERLQSRAVAAGGIAEVDGWKRRHGGCIVVTFQGDDGRDYDLVAAVDPASGRLSAFEMIKSLGDSEISITSPSQLSGSEREEVCALFERSYGDPDRHHIERQFETMTSIVRGRTGDQLTTFSFDRTTTLTLPVIGPTTIHQSGTLCMDPDYQRMGYVKNGAAVVGILSVGEEPASLGVHHFATPVTLHANLQMLPNSWPGTDVGSVIRAYAAPTSTQRAIGHRLAEDADAADYDEEHWVLIGTGRSPGEAATAVGLDPAYDQLFKHVNRARGDTLLGPFWQTQPPAVWFD